MKIKVKSLMQGMIALIALGYSMTSMAVSEDYLKEFIDNDSVVIMKSERKLYYFDQDGNFFKYPVAVGKKTTPSPSGEYMVAYKVKNPTWFPPESIRKEDPKLPERVPPGPKNPLGSRAIYLSDNLLRIHGTNKPSSVGKAVSHGCFRMRDKDIKDLYDKVSTDTTVYVFK
jgi:L,D-transpeptidase ErfK/SrfK